MRRKTLAGVAAAVLAVTAFAGCSDDDDDPPTDSVIGGDVTIPEVTTGDTETITTTS